MRLTHANEIRKGTLTISNTYIMMSKLRYMNLTMETKQHIEMLMFTGLSSSLLNLLEHQSIDLGARRCDERRGRHDYNHHHHHHRDHDHRKRSHGFESGVVVVSRQ